MLAPVLLLALLLAPAGELPRSPIPDKDLDKTAKDVASYFEALQGDKRAMQQKLLDTILVDVDKLAKKAKLGDDWLKYPGDWEYVFERSKPPLKELKIDAGKGFVAHVFSDPYDEVPVVCLVSLPPDYEKHTQRYPAIVALKPRLELEGNELEARAKAMAEALYPEDIRATHIVLVPLGRRAGEGRSATVKEDEGSWVTDDGLYTVLTGLRVLLEQLRFDRSRMVVDGWGAAGLDALRLGTMTSWFAGVVARSVEGTGDDLVVENLRQSKVLLVHGATDEAAGDPAQFVELAHDVPVEVVEETGSALAPSAETQAKVKEFLAACRRDLAPAEIDYKLGDLRFQSVFWLKAGEINRRPTAKPADPDFPRMTAKADRASNTIDVDTINIFELQLFLSDAIIDLDREVVIRVNGKERKRQLFPRDLKLMLENRYYNNSGDLGVYTQAVNIEDVESAEG